MSLFAAPPPQAHQKGLHYIADAKYPIVPVEFDFEAVAAVLDRIRTTSKPINFNWYRLDRPRNGEVFLESKLPAHVVDGQEVFPVNDDGYCWSSLGTSRVVSFKGCDIEVTRWGEGFTTGERTFNMSKVEYRLKLPHNHLFLVHYLAIAQPTVPIRLPVVPTIKPDPSAPLRPCANPAPAPDAALPPVPKPLARTAYAPTLPPPFPGSASKPGPSAPKARPAPAQAPPSPTAPVPDYAPVLDVLDQVDVFDSAAHRFTLIKSSLTRLTTAVINAANKSPASGPKVSALAAVDGLEDELASAIRAKVALLRDETLRDGEIVQNFLASWKGDCDQFWQLYAELTLATTESQLESAMNRFKEAHRLPPSNAPFLCL